MDRNGRSTCSPRKPGRCRSPPSCSRWAWPVRRQARRRKVLNLYSSRHYQTDEALYANFTKQTGIKLNRIEGGEDPLIERLRNEGAASPADVLVTVDAGRLWRAEQIGLVPAGQVASARVASARSPASPNDAVVRLLRTRARHRLQQGARSKPARRAELRGSRESEAEGQDLHALGRPRLQPLAHERADRALGEKQSRRVGEAASWRTSRARRRAATPTRSCAVAAGECDVAISNTYYYVRLHEIGEARGEESVAERSARLARTRRAAART